jgi:hypothetical protein
VCEKGKLHLHPNKQVWHFVKGAYYLLVHLFIFNPSLILDPLFDCPLDNQPARMELNVKG